MSAALLSPQLQRSLPNLGGGVISVRTRRTRPRQCSAIAVDAPSPLAGGVSGVRWGSSSVQGPRSEMEDDVVLRSDGLDGFAFAAVFDGHAGFSSVEFLRGLPWQPSYAIKPGPYRSGSMNKSHESLGKYGFTNWDELYKECVEVLQGGLLLTSKNFDAIKAGIAKAFETVDSKLSTWLEQIGKDVDSGATATVMFLGKGVLIISHVGDSCVVISRTGKAEILTGPHRPYGNNRVSLEEVKRIRAAGGWIVDGRICGDISVSRAFGDIRFKTKKNEMLKKGVEEGRWTEKFISRIKFKDDLVTSSPDIYQLDLGSDVEFILLASDGLWDYMKSSDAVTFVRNQLRQHGDVQLACEALAQATLDRNSQDNISIVIADLGRTDWQSLPPQGPNFFYEMSQAFATVGIVSLGIWISSFLLV